MASFKWPPEGSGTSGTVTSVALSVSPGSVLSVTGSPITTSGTLSLTISQASPTTDGFLSSTDFNTFNSKQSALTFSDSIVNTGGVVTLVNDQPSLVNSESYGSVNGVLGYYQEARYMTYAGNHTVVNTDRNIQANCAAGSITFLLPHAASMTGMKFTFKKIDNTNNPMDLRAQFFPTETIDGVQDIFTYSPNAAFTVSSDGSNWFVESENPSPIIVASANGFAGSVGFTPFVGTNIITLDTTVTGLLYGNGTAMLAATISAPLVLTGSTLSITQASTSTNGFLSSTDWNTFNNKQPAGSYFVLGGQSGGQIAHGDTASQGTLQLSSTANATKGHILIEDGSNILIGPSAAALATQLGAGSSSTQYITDDTQPILSMVGGGTPLIRQVNVNGTVASPNPVTANEIIGGLQFQGYTGTGGIEGGLGAEILGFATETYSGSAHGGQLSFYTTSTGSTSLNERMRIDGSGNVLIIAQLRNTILGTGIVHSDSSGNFSSNPVNLAGGPGEISGILDVNNGGTGSTGNTAGAVVIGNGHNPFNEVTAGTPGNLLVDNGTTWVSEAPGLAVGSQGTVSYFTSSGTFTTPSNTTSATKYKYVVIGPGGGGGGANASNANAGGGGAGAYAEGTFTGVGPSTAISITIATGGAGGSSAGGNGADGSGSTSIASPVSVSCGPGLGATGSTSNGTAGGAGGSPSGGMLNITGGSGMNASAGTGTTVGIGGQGASTPLGEGGSGGAFSVTDPGNSATGYGAGGGGGTGMSGPGGNGADGLVIITQLTP